MNIARPYSLQYDVLGLGETFQDRRWICICSAAAGVDNEGKSKDPDGGVTIMLSHMMADKVLDSGHVGTRIAWVRLDGPSFVNSYLSSIRVK